MPHKYKRYKWKSYIQQMHDLYMAGEYITTICKEIQNPLDGFTPCPRAVNTKFNSMGYPTDHFQRAQFRQKYAGSKLPITKSSTSINPQFPTSHPTISTNTSQTLGSGSGEIDIGGGGVNLQLLENFANADSVPMQTVMTQQQSRLSALSNFSSMPVDPTYQYGHQTEYDALCEPTINLHSTIHAFPDPVAISSRVLQMGSDIDKNREQHDTLSRINVDSHEQSASIAFHEQFKHWEASPQLRSISTPGKRHSLNLLPESSFQNSCGNSTARKFTPHYLEISHPPSRHDSAYGDSRPPTLSGCNEEHIELHPNSLTEFGGLNRTLCYDLHEHHRYGALRSQPQEEFRLQTCSWCLHTEFHTLSWSASSLQLEIFKTELQRIKSELEREITIDGAGSSYVLSLDSANNSSLHYAAAGGANFEHIDLLVQLGINPFQLNTTGQLFLHCWRPQFKSSIHSFDQNLSLALCRDINHLFELLPSEFFRWRDDKGNTVLDSLVSVVEDKVTKQRILELFRGKFHGQTMTCSTSNYFEYYEWLTCDYISPGLFDTTSHFLQYPGYGPEFTFNQKQQERAWEIIGLATSGQPLYVDPETGDNPWHALSRLSVDVLPRDELLRKIQLFLSLGVDLNLPNKEREYPLVAFIRGRPSLKPTNDETGAQRSKYLEFLIWKDPRARGRVPNLINVNIRDRYGASALYYAALLGQPECVKSLIERGANVNARLDGAQPMSILQAAYHAKNIAIAENDLVKIDRFKNVIDHLEDQGAVLAPTITQERQRRSKSLMRLPK